jgi:surfeit locus 1 family protein
MTSTRPRSLTRTASLGCLLLAAFAGLLWLGTWQLHRRVWKLALIASVQERVHAAPAAVPGPQAWPRINAAQDEYRRVRVSGTFLNGAETLVQASTVKGGGYWVMTPLQTRQGFTVLINRGFVPPERRDPATRPAGQIGGETVVTGLMRMSEPNGGFLHTNVPAAGRWYSRDVRAIAAARGLSDVAPYFIDADAQPNPGGWPVGGLTVISFPNSHLVYAITWYGLALLLAGLTAYAVREEWRARGAGARAA